MADAKEVSELWKIMKERIDIIEKMGYTKFITGRKITNLYLWYLWNVIPEKKLTAKQTQQIKNKCDKIIDKYK